MVVLRTFRADGAHSRKIDGRDGRSGESASHRARSHSVADRTCGNGFGDQDGSLSFGDRDWHGRGGYWRVGSRATGGGAARAACTAGTFRGRRHWRSHSLAASTSLASCPCKNM